MPLPAAYLPVGHLIFRSRPASWINGAAQLKQLIPYMVAHRFHKSNEDLLHIKEAFGSSDPAIDYV